MYSLIIDDQTYTIVYGNPTLLPDGRYLEDNTDLLKIIKRAEEVLEILRAKVDSKKKLEALECYVIGPYEKDNRNIIYCAKKLSQYYDSSANHNREISRSKVDGKYYSTKVVYAGALMLPEFFAELVVEELNKHE